VDDWCISCGPIDSTIFFRMVAGKIPCGRHCASAFVPAFACFSRLARAQSLLPTESYFRISTVAAVVHRFEESIGGRPYLIEVASVSQDRWRAYIVRVPGVPTALMPFYGATPTEAARLLSEWLTLAHARAASGASSV
jgi:hypothetical protein